MDGALERMVSTSDETPPVYDVLTLTEGGRLAHIKLDDKIYTLRITRANKLILTK
ncbi:MAG: hemin uptake protein HemP [Pseudomonadota bacterium]